MPGKDLLTRMRASARQTGHTVWRIVPVLLAVLLLAGLVVQLVPVLLHSGLFGRSTWLDTLLAAVIGSVSTTQPIVSYIFGGELLEAGVDLMAVTALIVSWVTVGVVPLPAEATALGWRFALWRNLFAFLAALIVSVLTVEVLRVLQG